MCFVFSTWKLYWGYVKVYLMSNTEFIFLKDFPDRSLELTIDETKFLVEKSAKLYYVAQPIM